MAGAREGWLCVPGVPGALSLILGLDPPSPGCSQLHFGPCPHSLPGLAAAPAMPRVPQAVLTFWGLWGLWGDPGHGQHGSLSPLPPQGAPQALGGRAWGLCWWAGLGIALDSVPSLGVWPGQKVPGQVQEVLYIIFATFRSIPCVWGGSRHWGRKADPTSRCCWRPIPPLTLPRGIRAAGAGAVSRRFRNKGAIC